MGREDEFSFGSIEFEVLMGLSNWHGGEFGFEVEIAASKATFSVVHWPVQSMRCTELSS